MKKLLALVLSGALLLTACGSSPDATKGEEDLKKKVESLEKENASLKEKADKYDAMVAKMEEEEAKKKENAAKTEFKTGEEWIVDGQFKLTVESVEATKERNEFSDKKPKQVVRVTYSYENLGYKGEIQDLYITPENLVDGSGEMADLYPVETNPVHPTPIGAKMKNAQIAYGLNNESKEVKVFFEVYDNDMEKHVATFVVPVK